MEKNKESGDLPGKKGKNRGIKRVPKESILSTSKGYHFGYAKEIIMTYFVNCLDESQHRKEVEK